jgi:hypothetical protein
MMPILPNSERSELRTALHFSAAALADHAVDVISEAGQRNARVRSLHLGHGLHGGQRKEDGAQRVALAHAGARQEDAEALRAAAAVGQHEATVAPVGHPHEGQQTGAHLAHHAQHGVAVDGVESVHSSHPASALR